MKKTLKIEEKYNNAVLNICLDTLKHKKQALVFVNSKSSAEAEAERIAAKIKIPSEEEKEKLDDMSEKILDVLESPTKQCKRLALCARSGVAFHHAGLHSQQREIIEDNFRDGTIKIICATSTLAYGLNLPAFRVIVRDLKRFAAPRGMTPIPVLEFLQFCGRAGRPDFNEDYGEAICIAQTTSEKEAIVENYINGEPEEILSKLAVEPILRTYVLSLVSIEYCNTRKALMDFFKKTFYAHQYEDLERLEEIIERIIVSLKKWDFITVENESEEANIKATLLGRRVSELYLDPYTANYLITCMKRAEMRSVKDFSLLQMISWTLELRPLLNVKVSEYNKIEEKINEYQSNLLSLEPSMFDPEYEEFVKSMKTALCFYDWADEKDEEALLEEYNVRPGEIRAKLSLADWLLFSSQELARLTKMQGLIKEIEKVRIRLKHGAREELLPLLRLTGIGRVRARKLFNNKVRTLEDVKTTDLTTLTTLIGKQISLSIKRQMGEDLREETVQVKKSKRKGQLSLEKYGK